jgi:hypothetical protein
MNACFDSPWSQLGIGSQARFLVVIVQKTTLKSSAYIHYPVGLTLLARSEKTVIAGERKIDQVSWPNFWALKYPTLGTQQQMAISFLEPKKISQLVDNKSC